jgi:hypothetical protein
LPWRTSGRRSPTANIARLKPYQIEAPVRKFKRPPVYSPDRDDRGAIPIESSFSSTGRPPIMSSQVPRVLFFDPSEAVAESAALALEASGYIVFKAATQGQARMLMAACEDLEVLIGHYDNHDGGEVGILLSQAASERENLAIVALSTLVGAQWMPLPEHAIRLEKPFDRDDLLAAVTSARQSAGQ